MVEIQLKDVGFCFEEGVDDFWGVVCWVEGGDDFCVVQVFYEYYFRLGCDQNCVKIIYVGYCGVGYDCVVQCFEEVVFVVVSKCVFCLDVEILGVL